MAGVKPWYLLTVGRNRYSGWLAYKFLCDSFHAHYPLRLREQFLAGAIPFAPTAPGNWRKKIVALHAAIKAQALEGAGRLQVLKTRDPWKTQVYRTYMYALGVHKKKRVKKRFIVKEPMTAQPPRPQNPRYPTLDELFKHTKKFQ